jgi:hypothetical protein
MMGKITCLQMRSFSKCQHCSRLVLLVIFFAQTLAPAFSSDPPGQVADQNYDAGTLICGNKNPGTPQDIDHFYAELDRINRSILLKDIDLERFDVNFRNANNIQGRQRPRRYFITQEGNAAATLAGLITAVAVRERAIIQPFYATLDSSGKVVVNRRKPSRTGLEHALIPQIAGQWLGAAGGALELGINLYHEQVALKKGFDPDASRSYVESRKKDIHDLFAERERLLQDFSPRISETRLQLAKQQGLVLQDLCNLTLNEYARFKIGAQRFKAFQDSLYFFDILKNASGACGGMVALYSVSRRRPTANGPAGLLTTISAGTIMTGPIISRLTGKLVGMQTQHKLRGVVESSENANLEKLEADRDKLAQLLKQSRDLAPASDAFLSKAAELEALNDVNSASRQKKLAMATRELRAATRASTENVLTGTMVGASKFGPGIAIMVSGFHFYKHPVNSNFLICDGSIAYLCGSALSVADNLRIRVTREIQRHRLLKERLMPGQVLADHMKKLDEIEAQIVSGAQGKIAAKSSSVPGSLPEDNARIGSELNDSGTSGSSP